MLPYINNSVFHLTFDIDSNKRKEIRSNKTANFKQNKGQSEVVYCVLCCVKHHDQKQFIKEDIRAYNSRKRVHNGREVMASVG